MTDQQPWADAIKAGIAAEMEAGDGVYDLDEVPGSVGGPATTPPPRYVAVEITRRWHRERRGDADMIPGGALTTHYRGPMVRDVRELRRRTAVALEIRAYPLPGGGTVGPFAFEFEGDLEYVDGAWTAFDTWRF